MIGAIIGDVVGSKFEFNNYLKKDFSLFDKYHSRYTDDSVMTCAVAYTLLMTGGDWERLTPEFVTENFRKIGRMYPNCGYGYRFYDWMLMSKNPKPYNSCGNGSAMRISPVGWVANSENEVKTLSRKLTEVSHNHPEGLKGAECTAMCIFLARSGKNMQEIEQYVKENYYPMDKTCDQYRIEQRGEHGKEICQISVPQALECFFESKSFTDCIRNCISIGGDSDTIGAIAGGIAEAYYGVSDMLVRKTEEFLDPCLELIEREFREKYVTKNTEMVEGGYDE